MLTNRLLLSCALLLGFTFQNTMASTILSTKDNWIAGGTGSTTQTGYLSTTTTLAIAERSNGTGGASDRKVYVGMDLSGALGINDTFANASFKFTLAGLLGPANGNITFQLYAITDGVDSWSANSITWANAPKNDTTGATVLSSGTTLLGSVTINSATATAGTSYSISGSALTDYLNWAAGKSGDLYGTGVTSDLTTTFILVQTGGSASVPGITIYNSAGNSSNTSLVPQLQFDVLTVPEPSTLGLGLIGLALFFFGMRRRARAV